MVLTADDVIAIASDRPWRRGMPPTRCRLRLYERQGEPPVAVVTELADNPGLSVTTAGEHVRRIKEALTRSTRSTR